MTGRQKGNDGPEKGRAPVSIATADPAGTYFPSMPCVLYPVLPSTHKTYTAKQQPADKPLPTPMPLRGTKLNYHHAQCAHTRLYTDYNSQPPADSATITCYNICNTCEGRDNKYVEWSGFAATAGTAVPWQSCPMDASPTILPTWWGSVSWGMRSNIIRDNG